MSRSGTKQNRRKNFEKRSLNLLTPKSINSDLAKQVDSFILRLELTTEDYMKAQNSDKSYLDFLNEDLGGKLKEEDFEVWEKTMDGIPILNAWYLNHNKFTKGHYSKLVAVAKMSNYDVMYPHSQENIELVFDDIFERVIMNGAELDLDLISHYDMIVISQKFVENFEILIKDFKKK